MWQVPEYTMNKEGEVRVLRSGELQSSQHLAEMCFISMNALVLELGDISSPS